jgi:hypothetical protein
MVEFLMVEFWRVGAGGGGLIFVLEFFMLITLAWGCFILAVNLIVKHLNDTCVS